MMRCLGRLRHMFRWSTMRCNVCNLHLDQFRGKRATFLDDDAPTPEQWQDWCNPPPDVARRVVSSKRA